MQVDLVGKVALIRGGSQGIGRAIVQQLADNGAQPALSMSTVRGPSWPPVRSVAARGWEM